MEGESMSGIIDLTDKLARSKKHRDKEKIHAAYRIFLCSGCPSKCLKCGTQLDMADHACARELEQTFRLCSACSEEYAEFLRRKEGKTTPQMYWHNEEWIRLWEAWITYQKAMNEYRGSKEFLQLLEDLNV
jgi:L-asparaginase II